MAEQNNIHEDHRKRMREKFQYSNGEDFHEHELLETLLFFSVPRVNTNEVAHRLINRFGSFHAVFEADYNELLKVKGVGPASAFLIKVVHSIIKRFVQSKNVQPKDFSDPYVAAKYFVNEIKYNTKETIYLALLNNKNGLIMFKKIDEGVVNFADFNMRKITEAVMQTNASSIYIVHNHPDGIAVPSDDDIYGTLNIVNTCSALDVSVKEHVLVAGDDFCLILDYHMRQKQGSLKIHNI